MSFKPLRTGEGRKAPTLPEKPKIPLLDYEFGQQAGECEAFTSAGRSLTKLNELWVLLKKRYDCKGDAEASVPLLQPQDEQQAAAAAVQQDLRSPLLRSVELGHDCTAPLLEMPAGQLMLAPRVVNQAYRVAVQLVAVQKPLSTAAPTAAVWSQVQTRAAHLYGCRMAISLAGPLYSMTCFLALMSEASSAALGRCLLPAIAAGLRNYGTNEFVVSGMLAAAEAAGPAARPRPFALPHYKERFNYHMSRVLALDAPEAARLRCLLDAAPTASTSYADKAMELLKGPDWLEPFMLIFSSFPLYQLRDLRNVYLSMAKLQMKHMTSSPGTICDAKHELSSPLVDIYGPCQEAAEYSYCEMAEVVQSIFDQPDILNGEVSSAADELLLRQKAMRQLGRMLHMDNLRATADQQRIVIDVTRGRHTCNQILKTTQATQAGCKALGDVVQDMATKLSQLQARLEQSEASMRQEESEEERRLQQAAAEAAAAAQAAAHAAAAEKAAAEAAAVASQLWRQIDQLPAAGPVGVAEGEPAGEAKGAAAVPDSAADEAGPGQGAAAGIEATAAAEGAAAAAVPAGFTACANPLFGSGGGCTPLPPHGHRRMLAAAAEKEQRAAN